MGRVGNASRQFIRDNRRNPLLRIIAAGSEKYLRAWNNESFYRFESNGEQFVMQTFAQWWGDRSLSIWDVGAHEGHWAIMAHGMMPRSRIESFEILPPTRAAMQRNLSGADWSGQHAVGLSDRPGMIEVTWNRSLPTTSSITPRMARGYFDETTDIERIECEITTADDLCAADVPSPDFLKIDVEGHEAAVLRGARSLLSGDARPMLIQFEYGDTWIPAGETLLSTQDLLTAHGYQVGRVFPRHVEFKAYTFSDDHFRMGNYVAVIDPELARRLAAR